MRTTGFTMLLLCAALAAAASATAQPRAKAPADSAGAKAPPKVDPDLAVQGEYEGTVGGEARIGVQVIALGKGAFQAVFLPGGLPGAGWDEKNRILCEGKLVGGKVVLTPVGGKRKYMAGPAGEFCATTEFPPAGQKDYTATIAGGRLTGKTDTGAPIAARRVERKSPTLGAKPPVGAAVLLAYAPGKAPSLAEWTNDKWLALGEGCMQAVRRSGSSSTKRTFTGPWRLHLEFRTPFMPTSRSQGRGNSGVFPPGGREVQVLDSFGLQGLANECGGVYKSHPPRINMCLPPMLWQTYDITYHVPAPGQGGQAWYKVVHNGATIHEKITLGRPRAGSLNLQDHGNPVSYRNIWLVPLKADTE